MFQSNTIIKSSVVFPEARIDHKRQSDIYDRADEHHVALLGTLPLFPEDDFHRQIRRK